MYNIYVRASYQVSLAAIIKDANQTGLFVASWLPRPS